MRVRNICLFLVLASFGFGHVHMAEADTITSLVGGVVQQPFYLDSRLNILQVEQYGNTLYAVGSEGGRPAYQPIEFGAGGPVVHGVQYLPSLTVQAGGLAAEGRVTDVRMHEGQLHYYGDSRSPNALPVSYEATVWNAATGQAVGLGFGDLGASSSIFSASDVGIGVGRSDSTGATFHVSGVSKSFFPTGSTGVAISADGTLIVGYDGSTSAGLWRANDIASLDYVFHSTTYLQSPGENLFLGAIGRGVFNDPFLGEIGLFETIDSLTFGSGIGAWDLTTGEFLRDFGLGTLADAQIYGDGLGGVELVVAMNSPTGSFLGTLGDSDRLYISDLIGPGISDLTFAKGGLYEGSLGFVALGNQGGNTVAFGTSYQFGSAAVPEPGTFGLLLIGGAAIAARQRRQSRKSAHTATN